MPSKKLIRLNILLLIVSLTIFYFRSPSVGFYVDQGKVIAINNPDYNVERTEVISSGKQSDLGLNLSKSRGSTRVRHVSTHLDLTHWVGHRILGTKADVYRSGVIKHVTPDTCDVTVLLDGDTQTTCYRHVLRHVTGSQPIVSDVTPSSEQVSLGSKFCVLIDNQRSIFVECLVYEVSQGRGGDQTQVLVKLQAGGETGDKTWVRRSQLRLTQVPWQEELSAVSAVSAVLPSPVSAERSGVVAGEEQYCIVVRFQS